MRGNNYFHTFWAKNNGYKKYKACQLGSQSGFVSGSAPGRFNFLPKIGFNMKIEYVTQRVLFHILEVPRPCAGRGGLVDNEWTI